MAGLITDIVVKRYAILTDDYTYLSDTEIGTFEKFYPERKQSIRYIDVVEVGGSPYILGTNAVMVSMVTLTAEDIKSLLEGESELFGDDSEAPKEDPLDIPIEKTAPSFFSPKKH